MNWTDKIKVYNEDCMKTMSRYEDNYFDLAIVDPPYGGDDAINVRYKDQTKFNAKRKKYKEFLNIQPKIEYFNELKRVSKHQIIWGVNFYNNFNLSGGRICWDKKGTAFGRAELAYYSGSKSVNICEITWNGMIQQNMKNKEIRIHPTQKPVDLYRWILDKYAKPDFKILDTHLGSGSHAIACHHYGCNLVAAELDREYYDESFKRFKTVTAQTNLF